MPAHLMSSRPQLLLARRLTPKGLHTMLNDENGVHDVDLVDYQ